MKKSMILNVLCASMIVTPSAHGMFSSWLNDSNSSRNGVLAGLGSAVVGGLMRYATRTKSNSPSKETPCFNRHELWSRLKSVTSGFLAGSAVVSLNGGHPFYPAVIGGTLMAAYMGSRIADKKLEDWFNPCAPAGSVSQE